MRKLWKLLGTAIFFAGWPILFVYFRLYRQRTRVIVTCGSKVLLVKGWIARDEWMLPGGGVKTSESLPAAAAREVLEETRVAVPVHKLKKFTKVSSSELLLSYTAHVFFASLDNMVRPTAKFPEIFGAKWFDTSKLADLSLSSETAQILESYLH